MRAAPLLLPAALAAVLLAGGGGVATAQQAKPPAAAAPGTPAQAARPQQAATPVVAAVIDVLRVLRESKAGKSIREQIDSRRKSYQEQIAKEEQKLNDADKELAKQRSVLSAEAFGKKREDLQKQFTTVQRMVQERRRQLDQTQSAAYNQLRVATSDIIEELIAARGLTVVLDSRSVVAVNPEMDLTPELVKRLDAKLPSVKVPEKVAEKTGR